MSRVVPMDQALTDEDRRYLRQLGANGMNMENRLDQEFPPDAEELAAFNMEERKAAAEVNGSGLTATDQTDIMEENARLKAELERLTGQLQPPPGDTPDYSGWLKADFEAEIDRVNAEDEEANLPKGTVNDMKTALLAYFAE